MKNKVLFLFSFVLVFTCFMSCDKEHLENNQNDLQASRFPEIKLPIDSLKEFLQQEQCVISLHPAPWPERERGAQIKLSTPLSKNVFVKFHLRHINEHGMINHNYMIFNNLVIPAGSSYVDVDLGPYWGGYFDTDPKGNDKNEPGSIDMRKPGCPLLLEIAGVSLYYSEPLPVKPKVYYNPSVLQIKFFAPSAHLLPEYIWQNYTSTNIDAKIN